MKIDNKGCKNMNLKAFHDLYDFTTIAFYKDVSHLAFFKKVRKKLNSKDMTCTMFSYVVSAIGRENILLAISDDEVKVDVLLDISKSWSNSEKAMLELAVQLFSGGNLFVLNDFIKYPTVDSILRTLDKANLQVAIDALKLKYV